MALAAGSLILANFTAKVKDTGELVETTLEDEAKKSGVHDPTRRYEPRLISVGEGWVLKGVDESLSNANVGDKLAIEVPPEKGFGVRDLSKIKLIPLKRFGEKASQLSVGDEVEVDNRIGIVRSMGSGRAQIDFNHRLAGKTLVYELEVLKQVETDREKAVWLIKRRLSIDEDKIDLAISGGEATIKLPNDYYLVEGLQIIKRAVANDIFKYIKGISKASFIEVYESPKPKEEAKPVEQKPVEVEAEAEEAATASTG